MKVDIDDYGMTMTIGDWPCVFTCVFTPEQAPEHDYIGMRMLWGLLTQEVVEHRYRDPEVVFDVAYKFANTVEAKAFHSETTKWTWLLLLYEDGEDGPWAVIGSTTKPPPGTIDWIVQKLIPGAMREGGRPEDN